MIISTEKLSTEKQKRDTDASWRMLLMMLAYFIFVVSAFFVVGVVMFVALWVLDQGIGIY